MIRICFGCDCVDTRKRLFEVHEAFRDMARELWFTVKALEADDSVQGLPNEASQALLATIARHLNARGEVVPWP